MARDKRYYYECVTTCQMGYMAPTHRREDFGEDGVPPMILHERQFAPRMGQRKADYLCTLVPLAKRYVEVIPRNFKKKNLRTGEIIDVEEHSVVKFRLLEADEIGDYVRGHARFMTLRDVDTEVGDKEVVGATNAKG